MENLGVVLFLFFCVMSFALFILYGIDKRRAQKGKWRIKESTLILMSLFGGSLGAILGMKAFRHKTKHTYFWIINYSCLILQVSLLLYLFLK